jgi:hypothetical protein
MGKKGHEIDIGLWNRRLVCIFCQTLSLIFTPMKLFFSIILAIGAPFMLLLLLPTNIRENVEINLSMLVLGIVFSLIVGERHLNRYNRAQNQGS